MTIRNHNEDRVNDAAALALAALGWILADERRSRRFLDLTGLTPDTLRQAIDEPATHRAVMDFLAAHEPDLIAAAEALDIEPSQLIAIQQELAA